MPRPLAYLLLFIALAANCYAPGAFKVAAATAAPELLDFGATWCGPCRQMEAEVRQIEARGMRVTRINVDMWPDVKAQWGVTSVPTFILTVGGRETDRLVGAQPEGVLSEWVSRSPVRAARPARTQFRARGNFAPEYLAKAQEVANQQRRNLALEWLGYELPAWQTPCDLLLVEDDTVGGGGITRFYFDGHGGLTDLNMRCGGRGDAVLHDVIPHEVFHAVLNDHIGRPLPRWIDEGAACAAETPAMRRAYNAKLVEYLRTGRGIATSELVSLQEYPRDIMPLYAQGHSLVSFLVEANGKQGFVAFVESAVDGGWEAAFKAHYDYVDLVELQASWLEWVRAGSPAAPQVVGYRGCGQCFRWRPLKRLWEHRPGFVIPRRGQSGSQGPPADSGNMVAVGPPPTAAPPADNTLPTGAPANDPSPGPNNDVAPPAQQTSPAADVGLADRLKADFEARLAEVEKKKQALIDGLQGRLNESLAETGTLRDKLKEAIKAAADQSAGAAPAADGAPTNKLDQVVTKGATWLTTEALMYMGLGAGPAGLLAFFGVRAARKHAGKYRAELDALRDRLRDEPSAGSSNVRVVPITHDNPPAAPLVARSREFVQVEVPSLTLEALQFAMDDWVKRNPGSQAAIEAIEAVARQYESGARKRRNK